MVKKKKITKKQFEQLRAATQRHWKEDILGASIRDIVEHNPISASGCDVCKFFDDNCEICFLSPDTWNCLDDVYNAAALMGRLTTRNSIGTFSEAYRLCQIAYKAILRRFRDYEKKHFSRK